MGVGPGQVADLVLLAGNPLEDIDHTREIAGALARSRYYDRAQLDAMLKAVQATARAQEPVPQGENGEHAPSGEGSSDRPPELSPNP